MKNEDVVGAAPTGDAPTTSKWSTILLPTKVRLILNVLRYYNVSQSTSRAPIWSVDSVTCKTICWLIIMYIWLFEDLSLGLVLIYHLSMISLENRVVQINYTKRFWYKTSSSRYEVQFICSVLIYLLFCTVLCRYNFCKILIMDSHSSPVRARYGVSVVILIPDSLSATVIPVPCAIWWQVWPHHNRTWLYNLIDIWRVALYIHKYIHKLEFRAKYMVSENVSKSAKTDTTR